MYVILTKNSRVLFTSYATRLVRRHSVRDQGPTLVAGVNAWVALLRSLPHFYPRSRIHLIDPNWIIINASWSLLVLGWWYFWLLVSRHWRGMPGWSIQGGQVLFGMRSGMLVRICGALTPDYTLVSRSFYEGHKVRSAQTPNNTQSLKILMGIFCGL